MDRPDLNKDRRYRIVRERVLRAMRDADNIRGEVMTQREMVMHFHEFKYEVGPASVSLWLTGRRNIPLKYLEALTSMLKVKEPFLLGLADNPETEWSEVSEEDREEKLDSVDFSELFAYDGQPLWVSFTTYIHEDGWAIYNRDKRCFVFRDGIIEEKNLKKKTSLGDEYICSFYTKDMTRTAENGVARKSLDMNSMLASNRVFVKMISPDKSVHALYDGWYHHNEDKTALISAEGRVLPYEGIKVAYRAFGSKMG